MLNCSEPSLDLFLDIHSSIIEIAGPWDEFLPDNHPLTSRNWELLERSGLAQFNYWYVRIFKNKELIGQAAFQVLTLNANGFSFVGLDPAVKGLAQVVLKNTKPTLLICGNLFRQNQLGFYFQNSEHDPLILNVAQKLTHWRTGKERPSVTLIKDCYLEQLTGEQLKKMKFSAYLGDKTMKMIVRDDWQSLNDYFSQLSKKYAQRATKIRLAIEGIQKRKFELEEVVSRSSEIYSLYREVVQKQSVRPFEVNAQYFVEMKKTFGPDFEVWGYFKEDQLVAFSTYHCHSKTEMEIHYIGFKADANETYNLYFNILFDGLERSILAGCQILMLGRGGTDAKASLGAQFYENNHYFWLKSGATRYLFKLIQQLYVKEEIENRVLRNPFKNLALQPSLNVQNQLSEVDSSYTNSKA